MNIDDSKKISDLLDEGKNEEAKSLFEKIDPVETVTYWMLKGKLEQKFQNWGNAINAYKNVLKFDNKNKEAINNIHLIQNIINFWNPEMFNP